MANAQAIAAALKALSGGRSPSGSGAGMSPIAAQMMMGQNSTQYASSYGPFLPRRPETFIEGAFGPMDPINPVPVDNPPPGGMFADPRLWQYRVGWNLPTPPGTEGLKLASFDQLYTLSRKYSVARQCIQLRIDEILGLDWEVSLTTDAAKAYQGDHKAMRDFGERKMQATKFFNRPDPDFWSFKSFMQAFLEEILVYDALSIVFRPKYGTGLGKGLLGSDLDHMKLVSGPTIRPLLGMHGEHPKPPQPAYQQYLYGVPRSDYMSMMRGTDIEDFGLAGAEVNTFRSDLMLYAPLWGTRESPYGFPPVERALLPIISGLQKQEFQLDYFTEGSVPAVYISPGDPNITPTQIKELQDALNAIAGDPAYHMKVVVLPPGSKVEPQRPVDLSDTFDTLVMNQVCMAFDVQPTEIGVLPNVGGGSSQGPSSSAIRFAGQEARDVRSRKATKPLLKFICNIFNHVLQNMCGQMDMQFQFEGLVDDEDKQKITELGVEQVQNGIASIDEVRERLDLAPWGLQETSEPVVFTAQGPIPFSMAPQLIMAAQQGAQGQQQSSSSSGGKKQGTNGGQKTSSSRSRTKQPSIRRGGQTKPNGSHPSPVSPHREAVTPGHSAAAGAIQGPTPRTGGTTSRSSVAGSRKKAAVSELDALRRHLRKGREISTWEAKHISNRTLGQIAEDMAKGLLIDKAIERAEDTIDLQFDIADWEIVDETGEPDVEETLKRAAEPLKYGDQIDWPGWKADQGIVRRYKGKVEDAFHEAELRANKIRKDAVTTYSVTTSTLRGLINDEVKDVFDKALSPLWAEGWQVGYESAGMLINEHKTADADDMRAFIQTEGEHWAQEISRTGLGRNSARSEVIARTEVARSMVAGAMQCYLVNGISHKELMLGPGDTCDICTEAQDDGAIPLDAGFSAKGLEPPFHPQCRCVPIPAGLLDEEDPAKGVSKGSVEDSSRAAFTLFRARDPEDGKWRYLLQQRDDGTWTVPGGTAHVGESPLENAMRETREEVGPVPPAMPKVTLIQSRPDKTVHIFLCECPMFDPDLSNLETPEETMDARWFHRKEVGLLDLHPPFRTQWNGIDWKSIAKMLSVNTSGEVANRPSDYGKPMPTGGAVQTPVDGDGIQVWNTSDPGSWAYAQNTLLLPSGSPHTPPIETPEDEDRKPQDHPAPQTPPGGAPSGPPPAGDQSPATSIGSGKALGRGPGAPARGQKPVRRGPGIGPSGGPVPAVTPQPYQPHAYIPVALAPDGNECQECGGPYDSNVHEIRPAKAPFPDLS